MNAGIADHVFFVQCEVSTPLERMKRYLENLENSLKIKGKVLVIASHNSQPVKDAEGLILNRYPVPQSTVVSGECFSSLRKHSESKSLLRTGAIFILTTSLHLEYSVFQAWRVIQGEEHRTHRAERFIWEKDAHISSIGPISEINLTDMNKKVFIPKPDFLHDDIHERCSG